MYTATLEQLKNWLARFIGENDYTSLESVCEDLLIDADQELASLMPIEGNKKTDSITVSSGVGDLPTDIDTTFLGKDQIKIYKYSSTTKYEYEQVDLDELSRYSSGDYVYALDMEDGQIKLPADATVSIDYYQVPDEMDDDIGTKFPVPRAVARVAAGNFYQHFEEDEDQAKVHFGFADVLITRAEAKNKKNKRPYALLNTYGNRESGFNG